MQRLYRNRPLNAEEIMENDDYHQLIRVMRLGIGECVRIFNNEEEWEYEMVEFSKKRAIFKQKNSINIQK